jgi:retinol dehydrogenase 12
MSGCFPLAELSGRKGESGFGSQSTASEVLHGLQLSGRVYVLTGGTSGLGVEVAKSLFRKGAHVVLAARNLRLGDSLAACLESEGEGGFGGRVTALQCDLSSLASVRSFAAAFLALDLPLHGLICNAAVLPCAWSLTEDGIESSLAVNFAAHALLADLLLPSLSRTARITGSAGRIVFTSSLVHHLGYSGGLKKAVNSEKGYVAWRNYSQSKLCVIAYARQLDTALRNSGEPISVFSVHPGNVRTAGVAAGEAHSGCVGRALAALTRRLQRSAEAGAASVVFAVRCEAHTPPPARLTRSPLGRQPSGCARLLRCECESRR